MRKWCTYACYLEALDSDKAGSCSGSARGSAGGSAAGSTGGERAGAASSRTARRTDLRTERASLPSTRAGSASLTSSAL